MVCESFVCSSSACSPAAKQQAKKNIIKIRRRRSAWEIYTRKVFQRKKKPTWNTQRNAKFERRRRRDVNEKETHHLSLESLKPLAWGEKGRRGWLNVLQESSFDHHTHARRRFLYAIELTRHCVLSRSISTNISHDFRTKFTDFADFCASRWWNLNFKHTQQRSTFSREHTLDSFGEEDNSREKKMYESQQEKNLCRNFFVSLALAPTSTQISRWNFVQGRRLI